MDLEQRAMQVRRISEKQGGLNRLKKEWDDVEFADSDKEIEDYLFDHGFEKVEVEGVNSVYYNLEGYVFSFRKKCEHCCYYNSASRYEFSKVKDPNDPQKVKAAINEANQYRIKYTEMNKVMLYGTASAASVGFAAYQIAHNFVNPPDIGAISIGIGVVSGMVSYFAFVIAGIIHSEAKTEKAQQEAEEAREIIAGNTNDSIVKLVETFSPEYQENRIKDGPRFCEINHP